MKDQLQLIAQVLLIGLGPVLAKHGITLGNDDVDKVVGGLALLAGVIWKFVHWNVTPAGPAQPVAVPINKIVSCLALTAGLACLIGCAPLQTGADPLVVNVERTETIAKATFDDVLGIDNSQRDFYRTNAPGFHNFCEWLRQPQSVPDFTSTNGAFASVPRCSAMLLSLDNVKLDYKSARASSNEVFTALQTVTGAMAQANEWLSKGPDTNSATH